MLDDLDIRSGEVSSVDFVVDWWTDWDFDCWELLLGFVFFAWRMEYILSEKFWAVKTWYSSGVKLLWNFRCGNSVALG